MSFTDDIEALKPAPKRLNTELDLLSKYTADLEFLKNGKDIIEQQMADRGINNDAINKKLKTLNKAIQRLEKLVDDYEKSLGEEISNHNDKSDSTD